MSDKSNITLTQEESDHDDFHKRKDPLPQTPHHTRLSCAKDLSLQPDGLSCGSAIPQTSGTIDPSIKRSTRVVRLCLRHLG